MAKESKSEWVKLKPEEIEKLIIDLAEKGTPPEKIGLILRDQHGIPKAKLLGKKIGQILRENNIKIDSERKNIENKIERLKTHFARHKHDYIAQRRMVQKASRVKKMEKLSER